MRHYKLRCNLVPKVSHLKTRDPENERECLHSKRKGLSPDFKKSEDAKDFKETVRFFTDNLMGMNNRFLSLIPRAKENKTVNCLQKATSFVLTYEPIESFCDLSCDIHVSTVYVNY